MSEYGTHQSVGNIMTDLARENARLTAELEQARAWNEKREAAYQRLRSQRDKFREERDQARADIGRLQRLLIDVTERPDGGVQRQCNVCLSYTDTPGEDIQHASCGICSEPVELFVMQVDHIVPRILGGSDDWDNLQPSHKGCNNKKARGSRAERQLTVNVSRDTEF